MVDCDLLGLVTDDVRLTVDLLGEDIDFTCLFFK